jgi:hypothetical protein
VHIAEGNLSEARRTYRAYHDLVYRELGVAPSEAHEVAYTSLHLVKRQ